MARLTVELPVPVTPLSQTIEKDINSIATEITRTTGIALVIKDSFCP